MDAAALNKRLEEMEKLVGGVLPLVGTAGTLIRLVGGLVRGKMSPDQAKTFEVAIGEYDAQLSKVGDALARLRAATGTTVSSTAPAGSTAVAGQSSASGPEGHSGG